MAEVDLVLARTALVMGRLRRDPHAFQRQADLPPDVFPLVRGGDVHISGVVIGDLRGIPLVIKLEEIELDLRADTEGPACLFGGFYGLAQDLARVVLERGPVRAGDIAEHMGHAAVLRPPGKLAQGGGVRVQEQIGAHLAPKAVDGGGVEGDACFKRTGKLVRHHGDVPLASEHIAEGQPDEFDVFLPDIFQDFLRCVFHRIISFILFRNKICKSLAGLFPPCFVIVRDGP